MPGLTPFLPSLQLPAYVCRNCGFWQRHFARPSDCPLCRDARHVLPPHGWSFYNLEEARQAFPMHWEEMLPGLWRFWNDPVDGIGSHSYLIQNNSGNLIFEGATVYSAAALEFIDILGGVDFAAASHPHTYGALWQLQDHFEAKIALHPADLAWTSALRVTHPFDQELLLSPQLRLLHAGVHFAGQAFLHDAYHGVLFCGDALKFDLDRQSACRAVAISAHKSFVRGVPLTPGEAESYREVFRRFPFEKTYSPFEQAHNVDSALVDRFLARAIAEYPQPEFVGIDSLDVTPLPQ